MANEQRDETLPQLMARLKARYQVREPEIAERIGASVSSVNYWSRGLRVPRAKHIQALHDAFPAISVAEISAAVGRQVPGPLSEAAEERLLELFRGLTAEQQRIKEIELQALNEANRTRR